MKKLVDSKEKEKSLLVNNNLESNNLEIISKDATGQTVEKDVRKDKKNNREGSIK